MSTSLVPVGLAYYVLADGEIRVVSPRGNGGRQRLSRAAAADLFDADKNWPAKAEARWVDAETRELYYYDGADWTATDDPRSESELSTLADALASKPAKTPRAPGSTVGGNAGGVKSGLYRVVPKERAGLTAEFCAIAASLATELGDGESFDRSDVFYAALIYGVEENAARIKVADCVYFGVWTAAPEASPSPSLEALRAVEAPNPTRDAAKALKAKVAARLSTADAEMMADAAIAKVRAL